MLFFFWSRKRRRAGAFFLEQKGGVLSVFLEQKICSGSFICSRNFIQLIFPASRETDLCSGSKREFFFLGQFLGEIFINLS